MKFGKELGAQMVQEWQEAYMDYSKLKKLLKDIMIFQQRQPQPPAAAATTANGLKRRPSLYRAFSGLRTLTRHGSVRNPAKISEDEVILVSGDGEEGEREQQQYQTMFLRSGDDGGEYELVFFRRLDDEFNKVNEFYKKKVEEVMAEADELSKQMNALIALRIKVDKPVVGGHSVSDFSISTSVRPVDGKKSGSWTQMEVIEEGGEIGREGSLEEEMKRENDEGVTESRRPGVNGVGPASLDQWKINVDPETPVSTLKCVLKFGPGQSFSKQELKKAEGLMLKAFSEFYRKLRLLKSFW